MEEDLVETTDQDQGLGRVVQPLEDDTSGRAGGLDPARHGRATASRHSAQEDGQQDQDWVEAQAHGQGRHGKLLWRGQWELDGLEQPVPELGVLAAEGFILPDQLLSGGSAAVLGLDSGQDLVGMVVDALATASLLGVVGDGAAGSPEPSSGTGDPTSKGCGGHRDGTSWVCVRLTTAPMRSISQRIKRVLAESCQVST